MRNEFRNRSTAWQHFWFGPVQTARGFYQPSPNADIGIIVMAITNLYGRRFESVNRPACVGVAQFESVDNHRKLGRSAFKVLFAFKSCDLFINSRSSKLGLISAPTLARLPCHALPLFRVWWWCDTFAANRYGMAPPVQNSQTSSELSPDRDPVAVGGDKF